MNTAGQIAVTLAALIGFGRLFLAGLVGKIALSI
jgi:hypothetical protein